MSGLPPLRRIVTGHELDDTAVVLWDGAPENVHAFPGGSRSTLLWCTQTTPASIAVGTVEDMGMRKLGTPPPPNGSRFAILDLAPGEPGFVHRSDSLDYAIVLIGSVVLDLDDGTARLGSGDIVVQRGTRHRWSNPGTVWARIAFILLDAEPLALGDALKRGAWAGES